MSTDLIKFGSHFDVSHESKNCLHYVTVSIFKLRINYIFTQRSNLAEFSVLQHALGFDIY